MSQDRSDALPAISIVIPFYNEEAIAEDTLNSLLAFLEKFPQKWELVLVNDGSSDDSAIILQNLISKKYPKLNQKIRLISYRPNRGRGYALRQGFACARGEYVVTSEFDLSYGLGIFSELYQKLVLTNSDVVIASPYHPQGRLVDVPFKRAFLSRFGNKILKAAFGGAVSTVSGMTRGYKRSTLNHLLLSEDGKEIHLEILYKSLALGHKIDEIPATLTWSKKRRERAQASSFKAGPLIKSHLLISILQRPLLILGSLTVSLLILGIGAGIYAFIHSLAGEKMGQRPVTLFAVMLILFASQIGCFLFLAKMIQELQKSIFHVQSQVKRLKGPTEP